MPFDTDPREYRMFPGVGALSGSSSTTDERRQTDRRPVAVSVRVVGLGHADAVRCTAADVSEGGMCVHAPVVSGLQVGQRCELIVGAGDVAAGLASALSGHHYATVVRTERLNEGTSPMIGAGLRFDQPLFL